MPHVSAPGIVTRSWLENAIFLPAAAVCFARVQRHGTVGENLNDSAQMPQEVRFTQSSKFDLLRLLEFGGDVTFFVALLVEVLLKDARIAGFARLNAV